MRILVPILLGFLLGVVALPPPLPAQQVDLVKLKKEEAERRKKLKKNAKKRIQVTNTNVKEIAETKNKPGFAESETETKKKKSAQDANESPAAVRPLLMDTDSEAADQPGEIENQNSAEYWQRLKRELEEKIADHESRVRQNESRLNLLHTRYLGQDLPLEKQRIKTELDNLKSRDEEDRARLKQLRKQLEDLHERARKAGVPPGWLR